MRLAQGVKPVMAKAAERTSYDYVIVGAGAAGCVVAARLTEDPDISVLLLEAGGWDRSRWIHIPLGLGRILQQRMFDWGYSIEPQPNVDGRRLACARGKVVGGSSSINSMTYVRGHRGDYDRWSANGLPTWSYNHVLPYFKRQESWEGGETKYRGGAGPVRTQKSRYSDPLVDAYIAAGLAAGYPSTDDYNGAQQEGFGLVQSMIRDGRRVSASTAYLRPALTRRNLSIAVHALATSVVFDGHRAGGVAYIQEGRTKIGHASREVILSGGTINSPQLLMLSGIGDPDELARHGIAAKAAVPGVGKNLQDHLAIGISYARKEPGPFVRNMRLDRIALALVQAELFGTGFAAELPSRWTAFVRSRDTQPIPDIQLQFRAGPLNARPYMPPFSKPFADGFTCRAILLRPRSRGAIELASSDPLRAARITHNFLTHEQDWETLRAGFRIARRLGEQAPLRPFIASELLPRVGRTSDAELNDHIRATTVTADHPIGTCKLGPDSDRMAVVDPDLRVRGVDGLRVVDASIMPDLIGGNIIASVYMIAEKASDLVRGRPSLSAFAPPDCHCACHLVERVPVGNQIRTY
jgi:4-pyridoxate dehydrogenase